mgnify:CR=1 FL=1
MIQVIFGKKGSGKTKRILDMANASVKEAKGNVLFIDDDKSYTLSLKPQIRFIDASEYAVKGKAPFYGFLAGILAGNYDISVIYVDAFLKLVKAEPAELVDFFAQLERLVANAQCDLVISFSEDAENVPEITVTTSGTFINNPGSVYSEPVITVYGSGEITLMVGMTIVELDGITDSITLDTPLMEAYKDTNSMNGCMSGDFPTLLPGQNAVSWTGNVTKVVIQPNWRYL